MAKIQRQFKKGATYKIEGPAKKVRQIKFEVSIKIGGKEYQLFRPVRKAKKQQPR